MWMPHSPACPRAHPPRPAPPPLISYLCYKYVRPSHERLPPPLPAPSTPPRHATLRHAAPHPTPPLTLPLTWPPGSRVMLTQYQALK